MRALITLLGPALMAACSGGQTDDPPTITATSVDCQADVFDMSVLASDSAEITNCTVDASDASGDLPTWYPLQDLEYTHGTTRWSTDGQDLACEGEYDLLVTVTNIWGNTAVETVVWPPVEDGTGALDPPWGSEIGGSTITIAGTGFEGTDSVLFDEEEAELVSATDSEVVVVTPPHDPGLVDVSLHTPKATWVLEEAFTYYPDATGLVSGIARPSFDTYNTAWFNIGSPYATIDYGPFVQIDMIWHDPVEPGATYLGNAPEPGSCDWSADYAYDLVDLGSYLAAEGDTVGSLAIPETAPDSMVYAYVEDNLTLDRWPGESLDLEIVDEDAAIPAMTVDGALQFVDLLADASFDWQATNTLVRGEDVHLEWTPGGSLDGLDWLLYPGTSPTEGAAALGEVYCTIDAGPGQLDVTWAELTDGLDETQVDAVYAKLSFWVDNFTTLAHDNSTFWSRGTMATWVYFEVVEPPEISDTADPDSGAP